MVQSTPTKKHIMQHFFSIRASDDFDSEIMCFGKEKKKKQNERNRFIRK